MDARQERIGKNEVLFRQVNERLREVAESFSLVAERAEFICECGKSDCMEPVQLTLSDYERVRSNPRWFFVRRGHEARDLERVIEEHEDWDLVEKHPGEPTALALGKHPSG
jgi:hypothetical protein